jgi:hypothetical protein
MSESKKLSRSSLINSISYPQFIRSMFYYTLLVLIRPTHSLLFFGQKLDSLASLPPILVIKI